jgi:hypothetical protein
MGCQLARGHRKAGAETCLRFRNVGTERDLRAVRQVAKRQGVETPLDLGPLVRGKWKGGASLPPSSPPRTTLPPHGDVVSQQAGATIDGRQLKHHGAEAGLPTSSPR